MLHVLVAPHHVLPHITVKVRLMAIDYHSRNPTCITSLSVILLANYAATGLRASKADVLVLAKGTSEDIPGAFRSHTVRTSPSTRATDDRITFLTYPASACRYSPLEMLFLQHVLSLQVCLLFPSVSVTLVDPPLCSEYYILCQLDLSFGSVGKYLGY